MNTVEKRIRITATHPATDPHCAAAARLAREATLRHSATEACRAVVDALSTPALGYEGIALSLDPGVGRSSRYQVMAGNWPPAPHVDSTAVLTVPLLLDDGRIGELTVYRTTERDFGENDAALVIAAASHAALGVARALLVDELKAIRGRKRRKPATARSRTKRKPAKKATRRARPKARKRGR